MRSTESFPEVRHLVQYTGRGGICVAKGQTVRVKASARKGYFVIEAVGPDGGTRAVAVKKKNLSPLQPQLF